MLCFLQVSSLRTVEGDVVFMDSVVHLWDIAFSGSVVYLWDAVFLDSPFDFRFVLYVVTQWSVPHAGSSQPEGHAVT
jgi:hypothetical protein